MKFQAKYWLLVSPLIKKYLHNNFGSRAARDITRAAKEEYKDLLSKADDIGSHNPMADNLYMALLFFSYHKASPELIDKARLEMILDYVLELPIAQKAIAGDLNRSKDFNKMKSYIEQSAAWTDKHRDQYPETWEFNFDERHEDGMFYYFTKCPIAKFFKDNNLDEFTSLFCKMDHKTLSYRQAILH